MRIDAVTPEKLAAIADCRVAIKTALNSSGPLTFGEIRSECVQQACSDEFCIQWALTELMAKGMVLSDCSGYETIYELA